MINKLKNNKVFHKILSEEIKRFARINESINDAKSITPDIVWDAISEEISKEMLRSIDESATKYSATQLSEIPENISKNIIDTYMMTKPATKQKFMNYLITNRLKNLLEVIDEF